MFQKSNFCKLVLKQGSLCLTGPLETFWVDAGKTQAAGKSWHYPAEGWKKILLSLPYAMSKSWAEQGKWGIDKKPWFIQKKNNILEGKATFLISVSTMN